MKEWFVQRTRHLRFPFRITIREDGRELLAVRAQAQWPGPGQQIFCLPEQGLDPDEPLEEIERVPVANVSRVGRKLAVALDRASRKRCEFLTVTKRRKDGGEYEQTFFRTESGIRAHRSRARAELLPSRAVPYTVVVDSAERYPWRFPGAAVKRRRLPVGDYALLDGERIAAIVERKTFDNLLGDIGALQAFHHHLAQLASRPYPALVIEAQYADFLDEKRVKGRWPAAHLARVLAELAALHPTLPIVYAGNRKLANVWCEKFFSACATRAADPQLDLADEALAREESPDEGGIDERVRQAATAKLAQPFSYRGLQDRFPDVPPVRIRRLITELRDEGVLVAEGRGRGTVYRRAKEARKA